MDTTVMEWVKITDNNRHTIVYGDHIKYFNGDDWVQTDVTDFEMDYGIIKGTNITLIKPKFGEFVYVLK